MEDAEWWEEVREYVLLALVTVVAIVSAMVAIYQTIREFSHLLENEKIKLRCVRTNVQICENSAVAICNKSTLRFNKDFGSPPRAQRCRIFVLICALTAPKPSVFRLLNPSGIKSI